MKKPKKRKKTTLCLALRFLVCDVFELIKLEQATISKEATSQRH